MSNRERNRADAMAEFRKDVIAYVATANGEFDTRIDQLIKLKSEISTMEGAKRSVEEAARILREAKEFEAQIKIGAEQAALTAGFEAEKLSKESERLNSKSLDVAQRESALARGLDDLTRDRQRFDGEMASGHESIARRQEELDTLRQQLSNERDEVIALKRDLNNRLEALRIV